MKKNHSIVLVIFCHVNKASITKYDLEIVFNTGVVTLFEVAIFLFRK